LFDNDRDAKKYLDALDDDDQDPRNLLSPEARLRVDQAAIRPGEIIESVTDTDLTDVDPVVVTSAISNAKIHAGVAAFGPLCTELFATGKWKWEYVAWLIADQLDGFAGYYDLSAQEKSAVRHQLQENAFLHRLDLAHSETSVAAREKRPRGCPPGTDRKRVIVNITSGIVNWRDHLDDVIEALVDNTVAEPPRGYRTWADYLSLTGKKRTRELIEYLIS
jgi:hypothetical protein